MCWETDGSALVTAEEFAAFSRREMAAFDRQTPAERAKLRETGQDLISQNSGPFSGAFNYDRF